tara:strand:+ start:3917 stop:4660 length:744 start_codon:yes stop_codon:yes gene_type:complete
MKIQKIKIFSLLFTILYLNVKSQENKQAAFTFNYNYQIPIGKLSTTFGHNSAIGASYFFENNNNIMLGLESSYLFGSNIQNSTIFENIATSTGAIISANGQYANINLMQRGFDSYIFAGYTFHISKDKLSGFYLYQGLGYLEYYIFIDTKNQDIPQLNENMKKGYDRFSNGMSAKSSIDYKYYHHKGRVQMSIGLNYTFAYTKNQRTYDFQNNEYYSNKRKWAKLIGFKTEIIIPIQRKNQEEFFYY